MSNNTTQQEQNTTQHETTRVQLNIIFFLFIYIIAAYSDLGILGSKALFKI